MAKRKSARSLARPLVPDRPNVAAPGHGRPLGPDLPAPELWPEELKRFLLEVLETPNARLGLRGQRFASFVAPYHRNPNPALSAAPALLRHVARLLAPGRWALTLEEAWTLVYGRLRDRYPLPPAL